MNWQDPLHKTNRPTDRTRKDSKGLHTPYETRDVCPLSEKETERRLKRQRTNNLFTYLCIFIIISQWGFQNRNFITPYRYDFYFVELD